MAEVLTVDQLIDQAQHFHSAGASVQILASTGLVSGTACDALTRVDGVSSAGALTVRQEGVTLSALPRGSVAVFEVTEGILTMFAPLSDVGGAGVLVSTDVAAGLGLAAGDTVATSAGQVRVRGIFDWPDDGRRRGFGYAMLVPQPEGGTFDECWLDSWPPVENARSLLRGVLVPHTAEAEQGMTMSQLNSSLGLRFDGEARFAGRITRFASLAALAAGLALGLAAVRLRRLELAAARHAGVTPVHQLIQFLAETGWWLLWGLAMSGAIVGAVVAGASELSTAGRLAVLGVRVLGLGALGVLAGVIIGIWSVREEHLFRYFKMGR